MSEDHPQRKRTFLPILFAVILVACIGTAIAKLYTQPSRNDNLEKVAVEREKQLVLLRDEKAKLEALAQEQDPCIISNKLAFQTSQASQSTRAEFGQILPGQAQPAQTQPAKFSQSSSVFSKNEIKDATVLILCKTHEGLSMGTGFFVAPDAVMTNSHIIGDAPEQIFVINSKLGHLVKADCAGSVKEPEKGERDYALLRVEAQNNIRPFPIRVSLQQADAVNAWGYPDAVSRSDPKYQALLHGETTSAPELIYSNGVVSAILERNPKLIVHTAPLSPGNSGGPLTDEKGWVVGINTMITLDNKSYRQTSIALPASDFIVFLQKNGVAVVHGDE